MQGSLVVHLYNRGANEWVVFQTGCFADRFIEPTFEQALSRARELAARSGVKLRIHSDSHALVHAEGPS